MAWYDDVIVVYVFIILVTSYSIVTTVGSGWILKLDVYFVEESDLIYLEDTTSTKYIDS